MSGFCREFSKYDVVVSNYNGDPWPEKTKKDLEKYVRSGGGFVVIHAADNSFPEWTEYNEMIGLGGWGNRNEKFGPYVRFRDGKFIYDNTPGPGGSHGLQHEFKIVARNSTHPIMKGLPSEWIHVKDELYDRLRGPAKNMTVLATSYSAPEQKGTGENEPILMVIKYGKGKVFHTVLGHDVDQIECVGFITTTLRGTEWAATGKVKHKDIPPDFPSPDKSSKRTL